MENAGLSAEDVFGLAIALEHEGIKFFLAASEATGRPELRKLFISLAQAEQIHERKLIFMRDKLRKDNNPEDFKGQDEVIISYLNSWVKDKVFYLTDREIDKLVQSRNIREILFKAIALEKEAIAFFSGLRDYMSDYFADGAVKQILAEEMQHLVILKRHLSNH